MARSTFKNREIMAIYNALQELGNKELRAAVAKKVARALRAFRPDAEEIIEAREAAIKRYAIQEGGQPRRNLDGSFRIAPINQPALLAEVEELMGKETPIEFEPIDEREIDFLPDDRMKGNMLDLLEQYGVLVNSDEPVAVPPASREPEPEPES